jgi:hypothetical protein
MVAAVILSVTMISSSQTPSPEPRTFFKKYIHLSDAAIESIERGEPVTAELMSETPDKIYIFGAVYIKARPELYLKFATDIDRLRNLPKYRGVGRLSDPPKLSDLDGLTLEQDEISSLGSSGGFGSQCRHHRYFPSRGFGVSTRHVEGFTPGGRERIAGFHSPEDHCQQNTVGPKRGSCRDQKNPGDETPRTATVMERDST